MKFPRRLVTYIYMSGDGVWHADLECGHALHGKQLSHQSKSWTPGITKATCPHCPKVDR